MANRTRRDFLLVAGAASAGLATSASAAPMPVRAALVVPRGAAADRVVAGAVFGAGEARHTAALLGGDFALTVARVADAAEAEARALELTAEGASALAGGVTASIAAAISALSVPTIAILAREDLALGESLPPLSVTPTRARHAEALAGALSERGYRRWALATDGDATIRHAIETAGGAITTPGDAQILYADEPVEGVALPVASVALSAPSVFAHPVLWHPSLFRYGAGELNERFVEATGDGMDEMAWQGWVAMKLILESSLRRRALDATRVDAHKGALLRFENGRLVQPVYAVIRGENGTEVTGA